MNSSQLQQPVQQASSAKQQRRGIIWVLSSFVFCPCHLPLTLGLLAALLGGTVLGAVVLRYSIAVGTITTLVWLVGTWYGFRQMRSRTTCAIPTRKS